MYVNELTIHNELTHFMLNNNLTEEHVIQIQIHGAFHAL